MLLLIPSAAADPAHVCRNNSTIKDRRNSPQNLISGFACICLLGIVALRGCASKGSPFVCTWVVRNGGASLIVSKDEKVGATLKGASRSGGTLPSVDLTYLELMDTILGQGFWGPIECKRKM